MLKGSAGGPTSWFIQETGGSTLYKKYWPKKTTKLLNIFNRALRYFRLRSIDLNLNNVKNFGLV